MLLSPLASLPGICSQGQCTSLFWLSKAQIHEGPSRILLRMLNVPASAWEMQVALMWLTSIHAMKGRWRAELLAPVATSGFTLAASSHHSSLIDPPPKKIIEIRALQVKLLQSNWLFKPPLLASNSWPLALCFNGFLSVKGFWDYSIIESHPLFCGEKEILPVSLQSTEWISVTNTEL